MPLRWHTRPIFRALAGLLHCWPRPGGSFPADPSEGFFFGVACLRFAHNKKAPLEAGLLALMAVTNMENSGP